jgi:hypothetical protein
MNGALKCSVCFYDRTKFIAQLMPVKAGNILPTFMVNPYLKMGF